MNLTKREEEKRLDQLAMRYLTALDNSDFDTLAALWKQAETDPALAEMLDGLNAEVVKDQRGPRIYRGFRLETGVVVMVHDAVLAPRALDPAPSQKVRNHSPDGFEWGYGGSGPAQLALAILLDLTGDRETARDNYQDFKCQFVASWQRDRWEVAEKEIRQWLSLSQTHTG
jgi:hypothetical protein